MPRIGWAKDKALKWLRQGKSLGWLRLCLAAPPLPHNMFLHEYYRQQVKLFEVLPAVIQLIVTMPTITELSKYYF